MTETKNVFPGLPQIIDKQFWSRPEGKFGIAVLGLLTLGATGGALIFLPTVLAYIATVFTSLFSIAIHGAGLFALIYVFFIDDNLRNIVGHSYRSFMRMITSFIIKMDPVSIVKDYTKMLRTRMEKMEVAIGNLKRQIASLSQLIAQQKNEIESAMKRMSAAKKAGKNLQGTEASQEVGLLQKSNDNLQKLHGKMELVYRVLLKMHEAAKFSISTTERKVDIAIREATALTAGSEAVKQAMKIINGDPARKQWFDEAMGQLAWETASAVAEIDNFMDMSKSFFEEVDLNKAVANEEAMRMLEEWEKNLESGILLGGGAKASVIADANNPNAVLDLNEPTPNVLRHGSPTVKSYFDN